MNFIRNFLRAFHEASLATAYDPMADAPDSWTREDAVGLCNFLGSQTGQKFKARLLNYTFKCALKATSYPDNHGYHNGLAMGVRMGVNAIQEHALIASLQRNEGTLEDQSLESATPDFALL